MALGVTGSCTIFNHAVESHWNTLMLYRKSPSLTNSLMECHECFQLFRWFLSVDGTPSILHKLHHRPHVIRARKWQRVNIPRDEAFEMIMGYLYHHTRKSVESSMRLVLRFNILGMFASGSIQNKLMKSD